MAHSDNQAQAHEGEKSMSTFQLQSGADTLDFDIAGHVFKAGAAFGKWSVTSDNKIQVTPASGAASTIAVDWGFNNQNQFELRQAGAVIFNFHADATVKPQIQVSKGALVVAPNMAAPSFLFLIHGTWGMDANFDLTFAVTGATTVTSTLDGILDSSSTSQFAFNFSTPGANAEAFKLVFRGRWQQRTTGNLDVDFVYDAENGKTGTIQLPAALTMEPTKAMLVYTYNKGTKTTSVTLAGNVQISQDFSLTYSVDAQGSGGIKSSTFSIGGTYDPNSTNFGKFQIIVKRDGVNHTLEIDGQYSGAIGGNLLTVGFSYTRQIGGTTFQDTIAFSGSISNPNGDKQFFWDVALTSQGFQFDLSAQITLSPGKCIRAELNVVVSGQQVAITAMFGISTNCGSGHSVNGPATRLLEPDLTECPYCGAAQPYAVTPGKALLLGAAPPPPIQHFRVTNEFPVQSTTFHDPESPIEVREFMEPGDIIENPEFRVMFGIGTVAFIFEQVFYECSDQNFDDNTEAVNADGNPIGG
jgi:hypothetical protein